MREKLLDLMKNEGLKPSQLAEMLGINPAGISHILAGRNKPSFELLQKILRRFPRIDPDWLLLDGPQMYRRDEHAAYKNDAAATTVRPSASGEDLFSAAATPTPTPTPTLQPETIQSPRPEMPDMPIPEAKANGAAVTRVIVLYADHTFESFTPQTGK